MQATEEKISPTEAIIRMISAINMDSKKDFYLVGEKFLAGLPSTGKSYQDIRFRLNQKPATLICLSDLKSNIKSLISIEPEKEQFVFLNKETQLFIDDIISEWSNREVYQYHNLTVRNKVLFYGPTGNGKTTIARHIAKLINLPFVEISSDMIIDSHIGSTGANIRKIFNDIKEPCVLFWDEIDSIGRMRGKSVGAADTENERMVNSILVNIEKLSNEVVFIGATNRIEILDPAFLRRFDVRFSLPNPSKEEKALYAERMFEYYKCPKEDLLFSMFDNYSQIKDLVIHLARKHVIEQLKKAV